MQHRTFNLGQEASIIRFLNTLLHNIKATYFIGDEVLATTV